MNRPGPLVLAASALGLFLIWSNSFVAIGFLLGGDRAPARLDWIGLTVARFFPAAALCLAYCLLFHARESTALARRHWKRLLPSALLAVPGYNLALYYGQQHGVPAPIASLTTALLPVFVMILSAVFLEEPLTRARLLGFAVAAAGMAVVAASRRDDALRAYPLVVAITALAPLCWSLYSVLSKPLAGRENPLLWTYLAIVLGTVALLPLVPHAWDQCARLDAPGWWAVLYLSVPCTVVGFAMWTWLLRHLPASKVGFTVFLNPPLTTVSKLALAALAPATFLFTVSPQELAGGALALFGLSIAVAGGRAAALLRRTA